VTISGEEKGAEKDHKEVAQQTFLQLTNNSITVNKKICVI